VPCDEHLLACRPAGCRRFRTAASSPTPCFIWYIDGAGNDSLHRLGRGPARSSRTAGAPCRRAAWRDGRVDKVYRALVTGVPPPTLSIDTPIGLVGHPRLGRVHAASPEGRPALTRLRVIGPGDGGTIVEVTIPTGRPHQIRIHLAAAGHPLVGDPLYVVGGGPGPEPGLPGDGGYRLHAHRLVLAHPTLGGRLELECGLPPDLRG
jgi:23S rRNA pseudouridine1911/1915/1917 synthase